MKIELNIEDLILKIKLLEEQNQTLIKQEIYRSESLQNAWSEMKIILDENKRLKSKLYWWQKLNI